MTTPTNVPNTEAEASVKYCHKMYATGVAYPGATPVGGMATASGAVVCIASQCMAWRWWDDASLGAARRGYCGLAGLPADLLKSGSVT